MFGGGANKKKWVTVGERGVRILSLVQSNLSPLSNLTPS
jgi:hypothetical protein